jgi:hypothetical protein
MRPRCSRDCEVHRHSSRISRHPIRELPAICLARWVWFNGRRLAAVLYAILPPSTNNAYQASAGPSGCGLASGSAPVHLLGAARVVLDSSMVEGVKVMRSPRRRCLWGCVVMALATLVLLPAAVQAKGGHSHSKKQTRAAVTQNSGTQLPQATSTASTPTPSKGPSFSSVGVIAAPAPPPPPTPAAVIGAPSPQQQPPTPLSTPLTLTTPTAGGNARTDSASPSSASPTEAAPTIPGGGGRTLQSCIDFWDQQTHMSKSEWKIACSRSLHRLENLKVETIGVGTSSAAR